MDYNSSNNELTENLLKIENNSPDLKKQKILILKERIIKPIKT